ncbi:hypothetical protein AB0M47_40765 [Hamadaea sp. NPDC051192]|uniref:hypothetical protein n=1 Tax=Hamadaea sp. NPDC051192 TaxID=3154940 RepID=UPI00343C0DF1
MTTDEYDAGSRMGRAWLQTDDGQRWRHGLGGGTSLLRDAMRALSARHGRDYQRGFLDATQTRRSIREPRPLGRRPERVSVTLTVEEDLALKSFRLGDGVTPASRLRAMLAVYRADPDFRARVDQEALASRALKAMRTPTGNRDMKRPGR